MSSGPWVGPSAREVHPLYPRVGLYNRHSINICRMNGQSRKLNFIFISGEIFVIFITVIG